MTQTMPYNTLFLSHGGGPMPLLGEPSHNELVASLKGLVDKMKKPDAIVIFSAHWEAEVVTITSASNPPLLYDYYGFPDHAYQINYPAQGNPSLAAQIQRSLIAAGVDAQLDVNRGFDHGVFVPLKIMFPNADIPVVQVSLMRSLDAASHVKIGRALQSLENNNLLIVGSGFTFHNLRAFSEPNTATSQIKNVAFEDWLVETLSSQTLTEIERHERLIEWQGAPHAEYCHPRAEHLLPLHVCYGFAGAAAAEVIKLNVLNKQASMYAW